MSKSKQPRRFQVSIAGRRSCRLVLILVTIDIAAGPYDLWIKSVSTVPYLISLLDSDNMVHTLRRGI